MIPAELQGVNSLIKIPVLESELINLSKGFSLGAFECSHLLGKVVDEFGLSEVIDFLLHIPDPSVELSVLFLQCLKLLGNLVEYGFMGLVEPRQPSDEAISPASLLDDKFVDEFDESGDFLYDLRALLDDGGEFFACSSSQSGGSTVHLESGGHSFG